jgi:nucleoside-diphosphate-sugar epimerase
MKTIAVTGSSGFIGRHLLGALREQQYNIIEIDIEKDLDISDWSKARNIPHFDIMIHLAAKTFVPDSFKRPHEFYFVNQSSTLNVLELARINSASVIYFSSYLYGTPEYLPIDEKHPLKPHNPYAQSKIICEKICEGYYRDFGVPVIIFRPFNIYGPGQNSSFLIPGIIEQQKSGKILLKDPRPKRDFIHVSDIIYAVMLAIKIENSGLQTFNLGTGKSYSVEEIVNLIIKYYGKRTVVKYTNEYRPGEVLDTIADIRKITTVLKWSPSINIEKGLDALLEKG